MSKEKLIDVSGKRRGSEAYNQYIKELKNPYKKDDVRYYDFIIELNEHRKWIAANKLKANQRKQDDQCKYILGGILFSYLNEGGTELGKGVYPFEKLTDYQKGFLKQNYPIVYKNLKFQIRSLVSLVREADSKSSDNTNNNKVNTEEYEQVLEQEKIETVSEE